MKKKGDQTNMYYKFKNCCNTNHDLNYIKFLIYARMLQVTDKSIMGTRATIKRV